MRDNFLPFALPDLGQVEQHLVQEVLNSGWLTSGEKVRQFEQLFAERVGAKQAVAVNSCTAAMHLALEAIGLQAGDEVITTPYTFAATGEVVRYFNAKPVFVDVSPFDLNINTSHIERMIGPRTKAIIAVHIAGLPADMYGIRALAQKHGLAVIEDAAHAFPARDRQLPIGQDLGLEQGLAHAVCFSFYATKTITTGEGGMLCTSDPVLADRCRMMSLHGISKDAWKRYTEEGSWYYEIVEAGYKYNLTDLAAALGVGQLAKVDIMWRRRLAIAQRYNEIFSEVPALQPPADRPDAQHAWHLYMLRLNPDQLRIDRGKFIAALKQRNIGTSVHFIPLHMHPYYQRTYGYSPDSFPVAKREYEREISLPIYSKMSNQDVSDVIDAVLDVVQAYKI
ncbi:MAG: DegT/DnrJ/EryC1/StrS family aminotransferase [Candidatus Promineifilaceae bacterium]